MIPSFPGPDPASEEYADEHEDRYREMCDEAGVDPLSSAARVLWSWRGLDAADGRVTLAPLLLLTGWLAVIACGTWPEAVRRLVWLPATVGVVVFAIAWGSGWWSPRRGVRR
ncbi:MAG: hypothetical protein H6515_13005 [Microthrixaceae bacterium]|nr:hypothetical protein [Microthrixaceae bacterium]